MIWLSTSDVTKGYAWTYSSIILHAVSRDPEAYAQPCIYCQLDGPTGGSSSSNGCSPIVSIGLA